MYLWIIWKNCTSLNWPWKNLLWVEGSCRYLCPSALVFALLFVPVFVFVFVKSQLLNSWSQLICITRARSQIGFERNLTFPICPTIRSGVKHWHVLTLNMDKDHQEYQRMIRFCCCGRSAKNFLVFKKAFLFWNFPWRWVTFYGISVNLFGMHWRASARIDRIEMSQCTIFFFKWQPILSFFIQLQNFEIKWRVWN